MHSPYGFDALDEIDDDEPLFVARERRRNAVRPLEELLSNVRRNHERALGIMSELHSHHRDFAQRNASVDNMPREGQNHRAGRQRQHDQVVLDELVEVEMSRAPGPSRQQRNSQREPPVFIDLTEEPDSPEVPRAMPPPRTRGANPSQPPVAGRNPRRQTALNRRTPSFSRSDGSLLGDQTNVIDLTLDDSPAAPAPLPQQLPRRNHPEIPPHHRHHLRHHQLHGHQNNNHNQHSFRNRQQAAAAAAAAGRDRDIDAAAAENFGARFAGLIRNIDIFQRLGFGRAIPDVEVQYLGAHQNNNGNNNMDNPIAGNLPHLDYRFGGAGGAAAAPNYEPPPPAREGFTRNTGGGNDEVIICPSCERELKYDPDAGADGRRPVKKVKTRKDQEVHHFWALKDCGHVYCKECYENRRVGSKSSAVRFRRDLTHARRNLCAVPDCPTEANNKGNWVGLFL
ncbi:uncharacterized protein C8A04DRAFT_15645 [Dichotomopilus funicola]|uniref:Cell cycle control protein n=1 Tax=Dichotomopilus funicola TaxID=1934379 RepID=A0AAN6ZJG4_9PEZI|nr:hypothetical protein C8A04DRAFT_15645 [Dichotomopilus funicola]